MNNNKLNISSESEFFDYHQEFIAKKPKNIKKKNLRGNVLSIPSTTYFTLCQNDYSVQCIKGKRFVKERIQYLIGWESFPGQDTWEYIENLQHIEQMIIEYEKKIKLDQIQKEALSLGITRAYDYDFSSRGKTLIIINQAENKTLANIHISKCTSEQNSGNTYISSSLNQSSQYVSSLQNNSKNNSPQEMSSTSNWSLDFAQLNLAQGNKSGKQNPHTTGQKGPMKNLSNNHVVSDSCYESSDEQNENSMEIQQQVPVQRQVIIRPYTKKNTTPSDTH